MLILLYSDTNYVLDGFRAEFSITNCLNNCTDRGLCLKHSCFCTGEFIGQDCSERACDCGDNENRGFCEKDRCECRNDFAGQTCSLHRNSSAPSQWHWLTNGTKSFSRRAAHTAFYHEPSDSVFIFGGYNLNEVLSSLEVFQFNTSSWLSNKSYNQSVPESTEEPRFGVLDQFWFRAALLTHARTSKESKPASLSLQSALGPAARYGHAICEFRKNFVIFGGRLANGSLSSELWLFNISKSEWTLLASKSEFVPPTLTQHTLTAVGDLIYLFGGATESGEFSSRMFRFARDQWEEVFPRGGKPMDYRIVGHTTNFHAESNSLIVYGGIIANGARVSKLSDRIFSFNLADQHWTEIFYPKTVLREMSVPRERAFHTATIAGSYLIVFGGYSHRHNKEEICYDNQMYLYHLGCHVWINQEALGTNRTIYPKRQGVFAHSAVLRGNNTLLIIGGYHGSINNDFLAFTLPDMESEVCAEYKSSTECIANPQCGWCSSDANCYGRTVSNCFTNLQTTRCPGICSALRDCQSCLVHGNAESKAKKAEKCTWCVQNAKCHQKNDYEPCGESDSVEKIGYQWWGRSGVEIEEKNQCTKLDKPPGLIYTKYHYPVDMNMPDYVALVNSTLVDFGALTTSENGEVVARLSGFMHLPMSKEIVKICGSYAIISLTATASKELAASFTADQNYCENSSWNKWEQQRVLIDLQAKRKLNNQVTQQHFQSKVSIVSNSTKAFTFEFLEPFSKGNCNEYKNCLHCLSDNACGWCDLTNECLSRDVNETSTCKSVSHWRYLILQPPQCSNCSNYVTCDECAASSSCEWLTEEAKCSRIDRSLNAIKNASDCPSSCHLRTNCSNCLDEKGRCVWCETTKKCFSFGVYTNEYQFGICREWIDNRLSGESFGFWEINENISLVFPAAPNIDSSTSPEHHQCKSCSSLSNCSTCLKSLSCGWCFYQDNPIEGLSQVFNNFEFTKLIDFQVLVFRATSTIPPLTAMSH